MVPRAADEEGRIAGGVHVLGIVDAWGVPRKSHHHGDVQSMSQIEQLAQDARKKADEKASVVVETERQCRVKVLLAQLAASHALDEAQRLENELRERKTS
jgi:hypothetical protein